MAERLVDSNDATVFLQSQTKTAHGPPAGGVEGYRQYHAKLADPTVRGAAPRFSLAEELSFGHSNSGDGLFTARGLACLCERGKAVSVCLRSAQRHGKNEHELYRDPEIPLGTAVADLNAASEFKAKGKYTDPNTWFSIADHCTALGDMIFDDGGHYDGLVVVCGSTNSAKSLITRGLIHHVIEKKVAKRAADCVADEKKDLGDRAMGNWEAFTAARDKLKTAIKTNAPDEDKLRKEFKKHKGYPYGRRPHLVTFEDPIEEFFVKPDYEATPPALATTRAGGFGVDYTPRELGKDVRDLTQAFEDALRQTPTVFFVGEVRDTADWKKILGFAATGHLVVTTAHAGSLLEMMTKILSAVEADTSAKRRFYAEKIRAVVHMRAFGSNFSEATGAAIEKRSLLLPSVWRRTEKGLSGLTGTGFGAVVPQVQVADGESCFGYYALYHHLRSVQEEHDPVPNDFPQFTPAIDDALSLAARAQDL